MNQRKQLLQLFLTLAITASLLAVPASQAQAAAAPTVGFGIGVSTHLRLGIDAAAPALQQAQALGFTWVREQFPWSEIEPTAGAYRFNYQADGLTRDFDRLVDLVESLDMHLLVVLDAGPIYLAQSAPDQPVDEEQLLDAWQDYLNVLANRYGSRVDGWEIGGSVNSASGWGRFLYPAGGEALPDPALVARMLRAAERTLHNANPAARIVLGGLSLSSSNGCPLPPDYFLNQLEALGAWQSFDVVSLNAAGAPLPLESGHVDRDACPTARSLADDVTGINRLFEKHGQKPIWVSSFSWSSSRLEALAIDAGRDALQLQPGLAVRSLIYAISQPGVEMVFPAPLADTPGKQGAALTEASLDAISQLITQLDGAQPLGGMDGSAHEFRFRLGAHQTMYLWSDGVADSNTPAVSVGWEGWKLIQLDSEGNGMPVPVAEDGSAVLAIGSMPVIVSAKPSNLLTRASLSLESVLNGWKRSASQAAQGWADEQRVVLRQKGEALIEEGKQRTILWFRQLIMDWLDQL